MNASTKVGCPGCGEVSDFTFFKKRAKYVCSACEAEFDEAPKAAHPPLRIFLSYGRDEFAAVAVRICKDLKDIHHHEVWFDIEKLKEGGDWEQYIEDGLKWAAAEPATGRIVFLMTPHSVRRPDGYCLNEIALGLTKSVFIVPVMLVWSEPPLSIYRLQYLDMRDTYRQVEKEIVEGNYQRELERLVEALEHRKLDFNGSQSLLLKVLEPINFSADVFKLQKDFMGRQWVFAQVDQWLADPEGGKLFLITGAPGAGKSALAAYLRDHRSQVAAFHFCDAASNEKRNPSKLVCSIACQLATQLPAYQERLSRLDLAEIKQEYSDPGDANTLFDKLVVQPLAENFPAPGRTLVVLIDALDEATRDGNNEIVRFLTLSADKTPPWLRFLLTARPEQEVLTPLQAYQPFVLDASGQDNQDDLTAYLKSRLPSLTPTQLETILESSEGNFLYVKQVCEDVRRGHLSLQRLQEFPRGLGGIYERFFYRQFGADIGYYKAEIARLLRLVLAAQEPLTLGFLKAERGWVDNEALFDRTDKLGTLFPRSGGSDDDTLRPFHKSVSDWLAVKASAGGWYVDMDAGHKQLAEAGWRQFQSAPETMDAYFLMWLPAHLKRTRGDAMLVELLKSFRFMMARLRHGSLEQNLLDYRSLETRLHPELQYEQSFFRERAHILRRHCGEWPAHKILLQLAVEHADNSPLTLGAQAWLEAGRCDWEWIRRMQRVDAVGIDPCLAVMEGHSATVTDVIERADGTLLSCAWDDTLRLWSPEGDPLQVLQGHTFIVNGVLERRDGSLLSWSSDKTLRLWSNKGEPRRLLEGHSGFVTGALELRDGSLVSWAEDDHALRLWSHEGDPLCMLEGHAAEVKGVLELRDGSLVSWAAYDHALRLWSNAGDPLKVLEGHTDRVEGVLERPDGTLVSWARDDQILLWSSGGESLKVLEGHTSSVNGVLALRNGGLVSWAWGLWLWDSEANLVKEIKGQGSSAVEGVLELRKGKLISWDGNTLRLWTSKGAPLKLLEGHSGSVDGALELSNGSLVSWAKDKTLRLWSSEGEPLQLLKGNTAAVEKVIELRNGTLVSKAFLDDKLRLWSLEGEPRQESKESTPLRVLLGHCAAVKEVLERSNGNLVTWADGDPTLRLWSSEGEALNVLAGHTRWVKGIHERADGTLVSWAQENTLWLWSDKGDPVRVLEGHTSSVNGVRVRHDGTMVSWSDDHTLRLWSNKGNPIKLLEGHTGSVKEVLERRDGTLLSWSWDRTLRLWSSKGEPLKSLEGHTDSVKGVLERRDGTLVSWAILEDSAPRLWSSTGELLRVLAGHTDSVRDVQELRDGTLLSWGGQTLRLWSSEGEPLKVLWGHTSWVAGVLERIDGSLVSWSKDGTLRLWSKEGEPLKVLEGHTGQVMSVLERPDGTLVSWCGAETLLLWSSAGDPLKVISDRDGEHGYFQEDPTGPRRIGRDYLGANERVCLMRFEGDEAFQKIIWQPLAESVSQRIYANGRMLVTQADGQVCFLQLYRGSQPISLDD